jgi:hypothetical protein
MNREVTLQMLEGQTSAPAAPTSPKQYCPFLLHRYLFEDGLKRLGLSDRQRVVAKERVIALFGPFCLASRHYVSLVIYLLASSSKSS